ncbi:MAG: GntR family transcriptional regulator [Solirubrobacterales bacterium]|nr:GntR family transcriptional regulator [Solirubrobacterales bacterium]
MSADGGPIGTGADLVYARLREAILHNHLAPGSVVSQVQLALQLGVSRTPLREAVRMLQREGLVTGEANRMVRVAPFSTEDVEELYAVRITNEALAIRLTVPGMISEDDAILEDGLRQMAGHAAERDIDAWERHHRAFHAHLVRGGGARLCRMLAEFSDHAERYRRLYVTSEPRAMSIGAAEHEAIVEACHARDAARAAAELARHLSRTALTSLTQIAPEHEPAMIRGALRAVLAGSEATVTAPGSRRSDHARR